MFELTVPNLEEEDEFNPVVMEWLKKTGDKIVQDEAAVTLEAGEWFMEVPSPVSGYLEKSLPKRAQPLNLGLF